MPNDDKLRRLAEFAGGQMDVIKGISPPVWIFPNGKLVIPCDWNPYDKPAHMVMMLEALVKDAGWYYVLQELANEAMKLGKKFDFAKAVCDAALEVMGQKGGG